MLVGVTDALSGGLYTYFVMRELLGWILFIYKHAPHIMNVKVLPESSLITKYVYRPPDNASIAPTNITTTSQSI